MFVVNPKAPHAAVKWSWCATEELLQCDVQQLARLITKLCDALNVHGKGGVRAANDLHVRVRNATDGLYPDQISQNRLLQTSIASIAFHEGVE